MKIKNIVWKEVDGADYGVAHSEDGNCVGNVRVCRREGDYEVVAFSDYGFRYRQSVERIGLSSRLENVRGFAEGQLTALLEAA